MVETLKIVKVCFYRDIGRAFLSMDNGSVYMLSIHDLSLKLFNQEEEIAGNFTDDCITIIKDDMKLDWIKKTLALEMKKQQAYAFAVVALGNGFGQEMRITSLKNLDKLMINKSVRKFVKKKFPPWSQDKTIIGELIELAHLQEFVIVEGLLKKIYAKIT